MSVFLNACSIILVMVASSAQEAPLVVGTIDPMVRTSGSLANDQLESEVTIEYDTFGVPNVHAASRGDAFFAEGFLHAQNRFSQMDGMRRFAAGELAALIGASGVDADRGVVAYRFREVARAVLQAMNQHDRELLNEYVAGVNAGLSDLAAPPPEYAMLSVALQPWQAEDSVLTMLAFTMMLNSSADRERRYAAMYGALPVELREYLFNSISRDDAPIPGLERQRPSIPRIPPREVVSFRDLPLEVPKPFDPSADEEQPGSNNWAISGSRTHDGRAILASDPHLQLTLPGVWYRIQMEWPNHSLLGLSLPGTPGIIIGSNGHVAWGFTNVGGDFQDLILIETDPENPNQYKTVDGYVPFDTETVSINVAGGDPVTHTIRSTIWGPMDGEVIDAKGNAHEVALAWSALHPELLNFELLHMDDAHTLEDAIEVLGRWAGPPQNVALADDQGRVAFTITGYLPNRLRRDGRAPYSLADGTALFTTRPQSKRPVLIGDSPESVSYVFSANNRTIDIRDARKIGYAWANPARARRIQDVLRQTQNANEIDMLALQMDTRTYGLESWKRIVVRALREVERDEQLQAALESIESWNGHADVEQTGISLLESLRRRMTGELSAALAEWAEREGHGKFRPRRIHDEPFLRVIEDRYYNWLPRSETEDNWGDWVRRHVREAVEAGAIQPWGEVNPIRLESPLAAMAPEPFAAMLRQDLGGQSGYWNSPKVLRGTFGASARMVVSPGHEEDGILITPGGQSGHPFSPHFRDLTNSWVNGEPLPLQPGAPVARFTLAP